MLSRQDYDQNEQSNYENKYVIYTIYDEGKILKRTHNKL